VDGLLEAAVGRKLADHGDQRAVRGDARALGVELAVVNGGRGEGCAGDAEGLIDDEAELRGAEEGAGEGVVPEHAARVERARQAQRRVVARDEAGQPVIVGEMRVQDVEAVTVHQGVDGADAAHERHRVLRFPDDRMGEVVVADLRLQLVAADVGVMGVVTGGAQRLHFREGRCGGARPAVSGSKMEDAQDLL
jgi:hypothetical protein